MEMKKYPIINIKIQFQINPIIDDFSYSTQKEKKREKREKKN